jgi:hypothetical protein
LDLAARFGDRGEGGGSITRTTTVTFPGGSATQTGNAVGANSIASAEVCSNFDNTWEAS